MDIQMPIMDGVEATRLIMAQYGTPIVVISSKLNDSVLKPTFQALEAGALAVIDKPVYNSSTDFEMQSQRLIDIVRSMAVIKPIKRRFNFKRPAKELSDHRPKKTIQTNYALIAIGVSIGGPQALKTIFAKLPKDFPLPIVVVQHMTPGFINGFVHWLNAEIALPVQLAHDFEVLNKGTFYFAPDHCHLHLEEQEGKFISRLVKGQEVAGFCPSITTLFKSVATSCGKQSIGVLLTGMGYDGAEGMLAIRQAGGHTVIQDEKSAVVFGMANIAQEMQAVDEVVELDKMADYFIKAVRFDPEK
jgi:two-component system chemotaxis response regulator CheB